MEKRIKNYTVVIEQDEDGWYVAKVPDIQGCATQGKTVAEVLERVKEAIQVCIEAYTKKNARFLYYNTLHL